MPRNWDYDAKLMAVVGRKGRGKSTLARQIIRGFPARWKIVFDHKGEVFRKLPAWRCTRFEHIPYALEQTQSVVFDPRPLFGSDMEEAFRVFCEKMYPTLQQLDGPKLFYFDEPGLLLPDNWSLFKKHPYHEYVSDGRSWEIDLLLSGQAPTDLTLRFRNQVTHWFVFSLGCMEAAEPLRQFGFTWENIDALEKGQYIAYDNNTGTMIFDETEREKKR